jgi:predicted RNase H-like HicB family nuclease
VANYRLKLTARIFFAERPQLSRSVAGFIFMKQDIAFGEENVYDWAEEKGVETMKFLVEIEQETDGRWLAEVMELPGVMVYGGSPEEAILKVQALALRVIADRIENGETGPGLTTITFEAA